MSNQAGSDSSPVSERLCPAVPVGLLRSGCHADTRQHLRSVNCLQYLATGLTITAVGPFQLPAPQSETLSQISSGTPAGLNHRCKLFQTFA